MNVSKYLSCIVCERFPQTPLRCWAIGGWISDLLDLTCVNSVLEWALSTIARKPIYMLMLLLALAGGASFAIRKHKTNLVLRSSSWVMAKSFSQMALTDPNGCTAVVVKSAITFNVSPDTQNNKLKPKDGLSNANLMSAKVIKVKRVTPPALQGRSTKQVIKQVTIFTFHSFNRNMVKTKFSTKGKGSKTLQTPQQKRDAMSHKDKKNQA